MHVIREWKTNESVDFHANLWSWFHLLHSYFFLSFEIFLFFDLPILIVMQDDNAVLMNNIFVASVHDSRSPHRGRLFLFYMESTVK